MFYHLIVLTCQIFYSCHFFTCFQNVVPKMSHFIRKWVKFTFWWWIEIFCHLKWVQSVGRQLHSPRDLTPRHQVKWNNLADIPWFVFALMNMRSGPQGGLRMSDQDSLLSRLVSSSAVQYTKHICNFFKFSKLKTWKNWPEKGLLNDMMSQFLGNIKIVHQSQVEKVQ